MPALGGSCGKLTLLGRPFSIVGDADIGQKLVRTENESQPNGDGTSRLIKKAVTQRLEGVNVTIDDTLLDFEALQDFAELKDYISFTVELPSGAIYSGKCQLSGEIKRQTMNATCELSLDCINMVLQ
jgi:hypothetical protein